MRIHKDQPSNATQGEKPSILLSLVIFVLLLALVAAIAFFGSQASASNVDGWYRNVEKVAWNPPNSVFGPAWTVIYLLIAISGFLLWRSGFQGTRNGSNEKLPNSNRKELLWYGVQLVLNASWTPLFFAGYPAIGETAWWLALLVILTMVFAVLRLIVMSWKKARIAAWLLVPYLLWITFASTLNVGIIVLN